MIYYNKAGAQQDKFRNVVTISHQSCKFLTTKYDICPDSQRNMRIK